MYISANWGSLFGALKYCWASLSKTQQHQAFPSVLQQPFLHPYLHWPSPRSLLCRQAILEPGVLSDDLGMVLSELTHSHLYNEAHSSFHLIVERCHVNCSIQSLSQNKSQQMEDVVIVNSSLASEMEASLVSLPAATELDPPCSFLLINYSEMFKGLCNKTNNLSSQIFKNFIIYLLVVLFVCMFVYYMRCLVPMEARRGYLILWNWSYR